MFGYAIGSIIITTLITKRFQQYATNALAAYDTPEKINAINDNTVKRALKSGVQAHDWLGYGKSFLVLAAYRQMGAFNAAKKCAMENKKDLVTEIHKLQLG